MFRLPSIQNSFYSLWFSRWHYSVERHRFRANIRSTSAEHTLWPLCMLASNKKLASVQLLFTYLFRCRTKTIFSESESWDRVEVLLSPVVAVSSGWFGMSNGLLFQSCYSNIAWNFYLIDATYWMSLWLYLHPVTNLFIFHANQRLMAKLIPLSYATFSKMAFFFPPWSLMIQLILCTTFIFILFFF